MDCDPQKHVHSSSHLLLAFSILKQEELWKRGLLLQQLQVLFTKQLSDHHVISGPKTVFP